MAVSAADGTPSPDVAGDAAESAETLLRESPGLFDWRQAVRVAEDAGRRRGFHALGFYHDAGHESPRLSASPGMDHSYGDVAAYEPGGDGAARLRLSLTDAASRFTLLGAHGVLPAWYSEFALGRLERGDRTLVDFLNIFEHRLLSLAYRGWWHHRLERRREKTRAGEDIPDLDHWLDAMAGLSDAVQADRVSAAARWPVRRFAPLFANAARTAWGLAALLGAFAGVPVRVEELTPLWYALEAGDCNRLPDPEHPDGVNCRLGGGLVLGERVREAQGNFTIVLGPMIWDVFLRLLPDAPGGDLAEICGLVRLFVGPDRTFGARLELSAGEIREVGLGCAGASLGWSMWLVSGTATPAAAEVYFHIDDDAILSGR